MAHVSMVTLGVDDLAPATEFYEAWGWRRSPASVEGVVSFLQGGTVVLGLFDRAALAADAGLPSLPSPPGAVALARNVASRDEVDAVVAQAGEAGGTVLKQPAATEWGGYAGYVQDLDGHLWEVAHNPHAGLDEDGRMLLEEDGA